MNVIKWLSVLLVALALAVVNLLGDIPATSRASMHLGPNDVVGFTHGWPTTSFVRAVSEYDQIWDGNRARHSRWPVGVTPVRYFGIFLFSINLVIAIVILTSTFVAVAYWLKGRSKPIQFGTRGLLVTTLLVAVFLCLLRLELVNWEHLAWVPIAAGLICIPIMLMAVRARVRSDSPVNWQTHSKHGAMHGAILGSLLAVVFSIIYFSMIDWSLRTKWDWGFVSVEFIGATILLAGMGGLAGGLTAFAPANNA